MAPLPISWIVLGFIVDDQLANELRQLTALEVSFLEYTKLAERWRVLASTLHAEEAALTTQLPAFPQAAQVHLIGGLDGGSRACGGCSSGCTILACISRSTTTAPATQR
jgi:hypothetical protein